MTENNPGIHGLHTLLDYDARKFIIAEILLKKTLPEWINMAGSLKLKTVLQKYLDFVQQHIQKMYQPQQTGGQAALNTSFQFAPTLRNADWGLIPQGAITLDAGRTILYSVYQAIATDILDLNQQARDWNERYTTNCMNAQPSSSVCNNCCPTPAIVTEFMTKTMPTPPLDRYSVILRYAIPGMPGVLSASYSPLE